MKFKKLVPKVLRNNFESRKPRPPAEVVRDARKLLLYLDSGADEADPKRDDKLTQLDDDMSDLKSILYGGQESEPVPDACTHVAEEFFAHDTMRILVHSLPKLNFEARKNATRIVANLQRQHVHSRLIASIYLEGNLDVMDDLLNGFFSYEDPALALNFGGMLRECIRHQVAAKHVLYSPHMSKFFDFINRPKFEVSSDAAATFKELMTRHKSTVAEFLTEKFTWFFAEFNSLLESTNYMTRRQACNLLGDLLLDRANSAVMTRYVNSLDNLRLLMNLLNDHSPLQESHKRIQVDAFHVFKLFVANQNKPADIVSILCANRDKLLRFFDGFHLDKEDETFEADKAQVVEEISRLVPTTPLNRSGELLKSVVV